MSDENPIPPDQTIPEWLACQMWRGASEWGNRSDQATVERWCAAAILRGEPTFSTITRTLAEDDARTARIAELEAGIRDLARSESDFLNPHAREDAWVRVLALLDDRKPQP